MSFQYAGEDGVRRIEDDLSSFVEICSIQNRHRF